MTTPLWLSWNEALTKVPIVDGLSLLRLAESMLEQARQAVSIDSWLKQVVGMMSTDWGAATAAVIDPTPQRRVLASVGRTLAEELPWPFLLESLDREQAGQRSWAGGSLVVAPIAGGPKSSLVLCFWSKATPAEGLAQAAVLGRACGLSWSFADHVSRATHRERQLLNVLNLSSPLGQMDDVETLLERIAVESTRLLDCDRASIFLWDKDAKELVARPALGVEGNALRLPDSTGVVGAVLKGGQPIRVDDAYSDSRFHQDVDQAGGYRTRNLLCVPLWGAERQPLGVFEVLNKRDTPFTADDEVICQALSTQISAAVQNTQEREALLRSHRQLTEQVTKGVAIIGDSQAISALRSTVRQLADTELPVLILGESGTGKEVFAQALHYQGSRASKPFVAVNCAALAETLLESELFGHEKGAFTDAREARRGKFELAEGGTIFLDEIGDLSPGGQAKLLRVLEQKVVTRVGGSVDIPINIRVVAATNAKLAEAVMHKKFRGDLYYRLNVVTLELPPLRDRADDVLPLAEHFLRTFALQARRPRLQLTPEARRRLQAHAWPGNVRELRNLMERMAFLAPSDKIEASDLAFILSPERETVPEPSETNGLSEATNQFQQEFIRRAIRRVRGNMSEAAKLLGLHRSNLYRKMRQLDMSEASQIRDDEETL
jgi:transcriptional regulator with GAF, ATPase, and Fis domain